MSRMAMTGRKKGVSRGDAAVNSGVMKNRAGMSRPRAGQTLSTAALDDIRSLVSTLGPELVGQGVRQSQYARRGQQQRPAEPQEDSCFGQENDISANHFTHP